MTALKQASFIGGEVAPALHARADLPRYYTCLARCRNFVVAQHGGARNRPGTTFVAEAKDSSQPVRLIPFRYSQSQTYVLEFGHQYVRFHTQGGTIVDPLTSLPLEVATPYLGADLARLHYCQLADVLTIVHPSYAPRELRRLAHDSWTLALYSVARAIAAPADLAWVYGNETGDETHPLRTWQWVVTAEDANGRESLPSSPTERFVARYYDRIPNGLNWSGVSGAKQYNVYCGRHGMFGYLGSSTVSEYADDGLLSPSYADSPPTGKDHFTGAGKYPSSVCYYEQRLVFAGSLDAPQTFWATQTGDYHSFDVSRPYKPEDGIELTLSSIQMDEIRNLVPLRVLLALTAQAEWVIQGAGGEALQPGRFDLKPQSYRGSSWLQPLLIGNAVLMLTEGQAGVRDLIYSMESDGYGGMDLSVLAQHLFAGRQIVDWAYAQEPHSLVWAVRDDGVLLGLTYLREQEVVAWHRHDTQGSFESVATVREGQEDAVYVVVNRTVGGQPKRFVERFASRFVADVRAAVFLDSALTWNGWSDGTIGLRFTGGVGGAYRGFNEFLAETSAPYFLATDVNCDLVLPALDDDHPDTRVTILGVNNNRQARVRAVTDVPDGRLGSWQFDFGRAVKSVSGLDHLEGLEVGALADGNVQAPRIVTGGRIDLTDASVMIAVGLAYTSELQTLPLQSPGGPETIRPRHKLVPRVYVEVEQTRGVWIGETFGSQRQIVLDPLELTDDVVEVAIPSSWNRGGQIVVSNPDPLPITVLAIIPEVILGD